MEEIIVWG